MRTPLHEGWTLRPVGGETPAEITGAVVPAGVPGCVHTDLLAAGLIPDPYLDDNEALLAWIGRADWEYRTTFRWRPQEGLDHADLVFEGLDTVARVELNGTEVGRTANMHRTHRFAVRHLLRPGPNELVVTFTSAVAHAEGVRDALGHRPHVNSLPFNFVRKAACNFGWDWGPQLVTAGLWRPVALEQWAAARLARVRPLAAVHDGVGRVSVHVDVRRDTAEPLLVTAAVGEHAAEAVLHAETGVVEVEVPEPELWWPRGRGEQPLYPVRVSLRSGSAELDSWSGRTGFRTVRLDTEPDEIGTPFRFVVNGEVVFARGVNWIPDDCFPHRVTRRRYAERLAQAVDAGVNLVRVWGGGIYESDDFYDLCDELGLLSWQDFLFACAAYPEEEPLHGEVVAEAREAVARLSPHPSLVLWNGGNENVWGYHDWGWQEELGDRTWGLGYYLDVLPGIVAELDPTRPYVPSSPWSFSSDVHPNDPDHGTTHVWDVWNERDHVHYRDHVPRFAAEFGFEGAPTWATLTRAVHDDPMAPDSHGVAVHQKADDGVAKMQRRLDEHFPPQERFEDWFWATQLNQAHAVSTGVEHLRSWSPRCAGTVLWQLNDCWPVASWAVVDGDGRRKPAWYALRRAYADRLLTVQPRADGLAAVLVNDTAAELRTDVRVRRVAFSGEELARVVLPAAVPARGTLVLLLPLLVVEAGDPGSELLIATADGAERALWFFGSDLERRLPATAPEAAARRVDGGYRVDVTARALLVDVSVLADRVAPDAVTDRMLVTLLPGESASFLVRTDAAVDPAELLAPDVLRTANQLHA
ncbi:glycoside hydrolase family 2 protein [Umezawaea beigongshangensis]|uniref:glycoside hydrolase family 2 protein n=1 Tax=Umezawaea beigongshangensis TaxID=2780383 RepID=UPI0018F18A85|nr:glycoside hydrolase family 2 protein [Umezawaea beigongshangensis]